jgi:hypothetical protein
MRRTPFDASPQRPLVAPAAVESVDEVRTCGQPGEHFQPIESV